MEPVSRFRGPPSHRRVTGAQSRSQSRCWEWNLDAETEGSISSHGGRVGWAVRGEREAPRTRACTGRGGPPRLKLTKRVSARGPLSRLRERLPSDRAVHSRGQAIADQESLNSVP